MAIDTQTERLSLINLSLPWRGLSFEPDGSIDQEERQSVLYYYAGILFSTVVPPAAPIGAEVKMAEFPFHEVSKPIGATYAWKQVLDAGAVDDTDNGGSDITNPDAQIGDSDHHPLKVNRRGTFIQVRLVYDDGLTGITDPVIQLFGRHNEDEAWQRLKNLNDEVDITLATDTALDVTDGTFQYTDPDPQTHTIDLDATDEVFIGVKTALAATGDVTTAVVQAKLIGGIRAF